MIWTVVCSSVISRICLTMMWSTSSSICWVTSRRHIMYLLKEVCTNTVNISSHYQPDQISQTSLDSTITLISSVGILSRRSCCRRFWRSRSLTKVETKTRKKERRRKKLKRNNKKEDNSFQPEKRVSYKWHRRSAWVCLQNWRICLLRSSQRTRTHHCYQFCCKNRKDMLNFVSRSSTTCNKYKKVSKVWSACHSISITSPTAFTRISCPLAGQ